MLIVWFVFLVELCSNPMEKTVERLGYVDVTFNPPGDGDCF